MSYGAAMSETADNVRGGAFVRGKMSVYLGKGGNVTSAV